VHAPTLLIETGGLDSEELVKVLKSKALGLKLTKAEIIEVSKKASSVHMIMTMTQREPSICNDASFVVACCWLLVVDSLWHWAKYSPRPR
jgi:ribosome biogenesis protein Tsr3